MHSISIAPSWPSTAPYNRLQFTYSLTHSLQGAASCIQSNLGLSVMPKDTTIERHLNLQPFLDNKLYRLASPILTSLGAGVKLLHHI